MSYSELRSAAIAAVKSEKKLANFEDAWGISYLDLIESSNTLYEWDGQIYVSKMDAIGQAAQDGQPDCVAFMRMKADIDDFWLEHTINYCNEHQIDTLTLRNVVGPRVEVFTNNPDAPKPPGFLHEPSVQYVRVLSSSKVVYMFQELEAAGITVIDET